ncbi:hybrid sensor histidine kinase/response regulator [Thiovibrio frasassiensis]|uniref:histidine kinase n=1 Tax=Thiovibrio frasassiensis TaxID=2984131 RepID=A0A9X4RMG2_9BACT|nr:hybrid sensor histidine kinase/response regulator [Thiovibrio frasassiensis]MDG4476739.1 response regulator [Thiovibrio frasassiensis]
MRISLFKKIFLSQLALIIIACGVISLASYAFMVRLYNDSQDDTLRILSSSTAMRVSNRIAQQKTTLKEIAEAREVALYGQKYQELLLARHLSRYQQQFPVLSYVDKDGNQEFRLVNGHASDLPDTPLGEQKVFRAAMAEPNQTILGEVVLDPVTQSPTLLFAYARVDYFGDQFLGLILGETPLAQIFAPAGNTLARKNDSCRIVAPDGKILADPEAKNIMQPLVVARQQTGQLFAKAAAQSKGEIQHATVNGVECYFALSRIPDTPWLAMALLPADQYSAVPDLFRNFSLLLFLGLLCLATIFTFLLARAINAPIRKLALASTAMANGDFEQRVAAGNDEIGDLAESFNTMAEKLGLATTREKHLLAAEASARLNAELADQHKSEFLAKVSHELRTPLNIILGMAQLLEEDASSAKSQEKIATIKEAGQNLLQLIDTILDFSRLESGAIVLTPTPFDLYGILTRLKKKYEPIAKAKGLTLVYAEPEAMPTTVVGDAARLFQILENLLDNAIKFTDHGEVSLRVRPLALKARSDQHIMHLRFEVSDTGCGIPPVQQNAMFESFKQIESYTTRKAGGLGIGLTLSQQLIALMHGEITMKSEPGKGSTFFVDLDLPVAKEVAPPPVEANKPEISSREITEQPSRGRVMHILVAEDNPVNQKLLRLMLEMHDHLVQVTGDGKEAVAVYQKNHIDLILMDVQMPEMNGFEATAAIRELEKESGRHVPIIAVTAHVMPGYKEECLKGGMDNYLSKPFRMQELFAIIEETMTSLNNPAA